MEKQPKLSFGRFWTYIEKLRSSDKLKIFKRRFFDYHSKKGRSAPVLSNDYTRITDSGGIYTMGKRYTSLARRVCAALMALSMLSGMLPAVAAEEGALAAVAFSAKDPVACEPGGAGYSLSAGKPGGDGFLGDPVKTVRRFHSRMPRCVFIRRRLKLRP